jgi:phenylacetate-CoA ligase
MAERCSTVGGTTSLTKKADEIRQRLKSTIGVTCTVDVKRSGAIPRSQGKAVRVIDLRKTAN